MNLLVCDHGALREQSHCHCAFPEKQRPLPAPLSRKTHGVYESQTYSHRKTKDVGVFSGARSCVDVTDQLKVVELVRAEEQFERGGGLERDVF